ncbi:MAG: metal ABC transporter solute-binding protein, Zn/Mn family [Prevotella sp.]
MKTKNILLLILAALIVMACRKEDGPAKPVVTVSIEPLRYFVEQIARDRIDVVTMVPSGNSPETYEPTARQMVALTNSDLYIKVGNLGFEQTWMKRLKNNAPHLIIADASDGIRPLPTTGPTGDPHTWMSPANALRIAYNIYNYLARIDAKDSSFFKTNLDSLRNVIIDTDAAISDKLKGLDKRSFIIYHPALTYYAYNYGLKQLAIEEDGREPSAASLQNLIDKANEQGAKLMFVQKEFANRNSETVRRGTGVRVVVINPLSYDWDKEILKITDELCRQ